MSITYRKQKGSPLTIEEMDNNFLDIVKRLFELEKTPLCAEGIKEIVQEGDQITIKGTFGSSFGPFSLPKVLPQAKGKWKENVAYAFSDYVQYEQSLYICTKGNLSTSFKD